MTRFLGRRAKPKRGREWFPAIRLKENAMDVSLLSNSGSVCKFERLSLSLKTF